MLEAFNSKQPASPRGDVLSFDLQKEGHTHSTRKNLTIIEFAKAGLLPEGYDGYPPATLKNLLSLALLRVVTVPLLSLENACACHRSRRAHSFKVNSISRAADNLRNDVMQHAL